MKRHSNITTADALVYVCVLQKERFQLPVPSQFWQNANRCFMYSKIISAQQDLIMLMMSCLVDKCLGLRWMLLSHLLQHQGISSYRAEFASMYFQFFKIKTHNTEQNGFHFANNIVLVILLIENV